VIDLADVSKRYDRDGTTWAVRHASLGVAAGELVAVLGESGSGKTTLLKMINRLIIRMRARSVSRGVMSAPRIRSRCAARSAT